MTNLSTTTINTFEYIDKVETVTIGTAGYYDITADGAQGGRGNEDDAGLGGLGAIVSGEIYLAVGAKLEIVVGGVGQPGKSTGGGGGGGGSFVIETYNGSSAVDVNEVIAGGGGGGAGNDVLDGGGGRTVGTGGGGGGGFAGGPGGNGAGGVNGAPGNAGGSGGGGGFTGGVVGQGGSANHTTFVGGGGSVAGAGGTGGFGGGGGGGIAGGGGGGYGGGGGGGDSGGGGAGSLVNSTIDVNKVAAAHSGNGLVTITLGAPPTIAGLASGYANLGSTTDTPFAGVTIGDPTAGSPTDTLTITLSDARATLNVGASAPVGVTFHSAGGGVYTLTGSADNITSELDGLTLNAPSTLIGVVNGVEAVGVSLSDASSAYLVAPTTAAATLDILAQGFTKTFDYTGAIDSFTVQTSGYYKIAADGAQGGSGVLPNTGWLGAMASGEVYLQAGAKLEIVVGGEGQGSTVGGGGGGGGSFVIETNDGSGAVNVDEVIAGGGGGSFIGPSGGGGGGRIQPTGGTGGEGGGTAAHGAGVGGVDGAAGQGATNGFLLGGGGGGGFTGGDSGFSAAPQNGSVKGETFAGGGGASGGAGGGFGGGGGGGRGGGGGGGGGYGGGGGGILGGGGGGSFVSAAAYGVSQTAASISGNGLITITQVFASTITGAGGETYASAGSSADKPFAGVTIADTNPNSPTETLTITLGDANASLSEGSSFTGTETLTPVSATPGQYTLTGGAANVTAELDALTLHAPSTVTSANGVEAMNISLSDLSNADAVPATASVTANILGPNFSDTFNYSGAIQTFTVQTSGYYDIAADGAQGGGGYGSAVGGLGAMASGEVFLQAGATLEIVAGGEGATGGLGGGGGGGGSFVIETNNGSGAVKVDEVIAGGGGGGSFGAGGGGQTIGSGGNGRGAAGTPGGGAAGTPGAGGAGGAAGHGGKASRGYGGGGGGFTGGPGGTFTTFGHGGSATGNSFAGGSSPSGGGGGGFGGGGGGSGIGGGGGGGYGGGGGGGYSGGGGGGGSFVDSDLGVVKAAATNSGNGFVTVTALTTPSITVAAPATHSTTSTTPVEPFAGDLVTDPNFGSPTETLTVTPSADTNGVLSDPNSATDGSSVDPVTGVFSVTGAAQAVTTALDGLVFTPSAGAAGTTTSFTISDTSSAYPLAVTDSTTIVADAACYREGTRIRTVRGEVAVEDLAVGDGVVTASGPVRAICWIGRRRLDCARHPNPVNVWPVRVRAHAFGENLPQRDLWLSPGHNIACEGVLMPISALLNGQSVEQIKQDRVEYWHVELEAHDIILAEGLPAESYLDCGNRTAFANGGAFVEAHPDFQPKHWAETCLPLVCEGPAIAATKARLLARLAERGCGVTQEADAHIWIDGVRIEPTRLGETQLTFALPAEGREISLRSRHFAPAHTVAESHDLRTLGLCVAGLQIDGFAVSLERDEACMCGWREAEYEGETFTHRWTTGVTPLPDGARVVILDLAGVGYYWSNKRDNIVAVSA